MNNPFSPKKEIDEYLLRFLLQKKTELKNHPWGKDVINRLKKSLPRGKTLRGSLVVTTNKILGRFNNNSTAVGAAMELLHLSLLIHDDIMDRDKLRRGRPSINAQYETWGKQNKIKEPEHFGYNLAQCLGIIAQTWPFEIINNLKILATIKQKLGKELSRELVNVALAQMQDVYGGSTKKSLREKEIDYIMINKTARYTFSLPFKLGCILSGRDKKTTTKLEKLGEYLGIIFQIKDDELGLFGNETVIGKPVGSDLKEGKQTIFINKLIKKCSPAEKNIVKRILAKRLITKVDIFYIRELLKNYNIVDEVKEKTKILEKQALALVDTMEIKSADKNNLKNTISLLTDREK